MTNWGPSRTRPGGRRRELSPARREVLELLDDADGGMTVAEVAAVTGSHTNTAREHLDGLVESGYLVRAQLPAVGRGRPPMIYRTVPNDRDVAAEYRMLAEILVDQLTEEWPDPVARRAHARGVGEEWVRRRGEQERARALAQAMFDPEPMPGKVTAPGCLPAVTVRMRCCPVRDLARAYPDVVCAVHLGVLRGTCADPVAAAQVDVVPFGDVGACLVNVPLAATDLAAAVGVLDPR